MKKLLLTIAVVLLFPIMGNAQMLTWDKNTEVDMKDYQVYMCFVAACVVTKTPTMLQGTVAHPANTFPMPVGKEGTVGVTARDLSLNESPLSVSIPFDLAAPKVPVNLRQTP